jgi:hypothetical protein
LATLSSLFLHWRSILYYQMAACTVRRIPVAAVCALRDPFHFRVVNGIALERED